MAPLDRSQIQGFLIDVDGVLCVAMQPIPGAAEMLDALLERSIPFRLVTNATIASRATLTAKLQDMGLSVAPELVFSAAAATAAYVARRFPGEPCYLLSKGDAIDDFHEVGVQIVGPDGEPPASVVVIGGAEDELTYARLNHAYRLLLGGAKLVAMHRNVAWLTETGMTLDSGPFVRALASAAGVRAVVVGKPNRAMFQVALRDLALPAAQVAMIGDDARNDIAPARRLGMLGILVRSGKPVGAQEEALADVTLNSIADLRELLRGPA